MSSVTDSSHQPVTYTWIMWRGRVYGELASTCTYWYTLQSILKRHSTFLCVLFCFFIESSLQDSCGDKVPNQGFDRHIKPTETLNHSREHAVAAKGSAPIWWVQGRRESEERYETNWGFIGKRFWIRVLNPLPIFSIQRHFPSPKLVGDQFILKCFSNSVDLCLFESWPCALKWRGDCQSLRNSFFSSICKKKKSSLN